mgnify:CR=1 FL=1
MKTPSGKAILFSKPGISLRKSSSQDCIFRRITCPEQIIENEFANVVPPERAADFALRLLQSNSIRETIAKYEPGDYFDGSPEYDQLYTELIGVIIDLLEADGVKVLP